MSDLLLHLPRTYVTYTVCPSIHSALQKADGTGVIVQGRIAEATVQRSRTRRYLAVETAVLADERDKLVLRWFVPFRGPLPRPRLESGRWVCLRGIMGSYGSSRILQDAEVVEQICRTREWAEPVYPLTRGISQTMLRRWILSALELVTGTAEPLPSPETAALPDPAALHEDELLRAIHRLHVPGTLGDAEYGRRVLALWEIARLRKSQLAVAVGPSTSQRWPERDGPLVQAFLQQLPFSLTKAQQRVIGEVRADMARARGMRRMLCGDVGTGKSVVIAYALLKGVEAGGQGLLVVPTRILAAQHYETLRTLYRNLGVRLALLTAQLTDGERRRLLSEIRRGAVDVIVATQAAFMPEVEYNRLLVGVIDEQHRFGVAQRLALEKQKPLHCLWVSATPIPKSMAQIVYGGVPVSFLDQRPAGRLPVETRWVPLSKRERVYDFVDKEIRTGGRAFVVCPVIEEDEEAGIPGARQTWERLRRKRPGGYPVALIHGRLPDDEQEMAMESFVKGEARTLVATSMVEVGVDVPEATVIVIEGADRFGLAQLHQLRGRVGRGNRPGYAILLADAGTTYARQRLMTIRSVHDGFALAEADLRLRGPGEFLGMRQSGLTDLRFADLKSDLDLFQSLLQVEASPERE